MDVAHLFLPVIAGLIGYLVRHIDVFGQGGTLPSPTAATAQSPHPVLDALAALIQEQLRQRSAVVTDTRTPTVPPAA